MSKRGAGWWGSAGAVLASALLAACAGPLMAHPTAVQVVRYTAQGPQSATIRNAGAAAALAQAFDHLPRAPGHDHRCDGTAIADPQGYLSVTFIYRHHAPVELLSFACPVIAVVGRGGRPIHARTLTPAFQARVDALLGTP